MDSKKGTSVEVIELGVCKALDELEWALKNYVEEDMTPLDYWVEVHGTPDGFFEQGEFE